ncbi:trypsin-like cysteine/serine peptidase domain-containing protein [Xylaria curta]|nr:trypsin-like cysteine/serine peptidase domain-containing protein [Xylaria curta]
MSARDITHSNSAVIEKHSKERTCYNKQTSSISVLSALRTRYPHPFGQQLWFHFRMYQVLLGAAILFLSNITPKTENEKICSRLKPPIDAIYSLIKEIWQGTKVRLRINSGTTHEDKLITWKEISSDFDITISQGNHSRIIWDTIQAKPFLQSQCFMTTTHQLKERRDHILRNFDVQLAKLGSTLAQIIGPSMKVLDAACDPPSAVIRDLPEIAAWELESSIQDRARELSLTNLDYYSNGTGANEVTFGRYPRSQVTKRHLRGNKWLKGIVALSLHFQTPSGPVDARATGWLVSHHIVATSGHCVFNENHGCLTSVVVTSGYGLPNMTSESRKGVFAAAHWRWYKAFEEKHDLAFIKLNKPFRKASPIPCIPAPAGVDQLSIKVAGYPGDMEDGKMYMAEGKAWYDPTVKKKDSRDNMLVHVVDTYGGNSGSPVIDSQGNAIAVHCAGDKSFGNQAAVIDDQSNNFVTIHRLLRQVPPNREEDEGVRWYDIGTACNGYVVTRFQLWDGYE